MIKQQILTRQKVYTHNANQYCKWYTKQLIISLDSWKRTVQCTVIRFGRATAHDFGLEGLISEFGGSALPSPTLYTALYAVSTARAHHFRARRLVYWVHRLMAHGLDFPHCLLVIYKQKSRPYGGVLLLSYKIGCRRYSGVYFSVRDTCRLWHGSFVKGRN